MPDVVGEPPDQAATEIQNKGLIPRAPSSVPVTDPAQDGKVLTTSPRAGILSREGTPVIIVVGSYVPTNTDTTKTDTTRPTRRRPTPRRRPRRLRPGQ